MMGVAVLSRRVSTPVFAEIDLESRVLFSTPDRLDSLDSVCDVREIDKSAALLAKSIDQLNVAIFGKVLS